MKLLRARPRTIAAVACALAAVTLPPVVAPAFFSPAFVVVPAFVVMSTLALCLLAAAIAVHDLASMLIPDRYTAGILAVALAGGWFGPDDPAALFWRLGQGGALLLLLCLFDVAYRRLRGRDGIGLGDIKLIGASAVLVGLGGAGAQIVLASVAALIFCVIRAVRLRRPLRAVAKVPFGAFLAPALVIVRAWLPVAW